MALFNQVVKIFNKPDPSQPEEGGPRIPFWESPERTGWLMKQGAHIKTWCAASRCARSAWLPFHPGARGLRFPPTADAEPPRPPVC